MAIFRKSGKRLLFGLVLLVMVLLATRYIPTRTVTHKITIQEQAPTTRDTYEVKAPAYVLNTTAEQKIAKAMNLIRLLEASQSQTLQAAISTYRLKTGRNPPKHYDKWFAYAREKQCLIDNYDTLHKDLEPFFKLPPQEFRDRIKMLVEAGAAPDGEHSYHFIRINQGVVTGPSGRDSPVPGWMGAWLSLIEKHAADIDDLALVFNPYDEPRVVYNHKQANAVQEALYSPLERVDWHRPSAEEHYEWLLERCPYRESPFSKLLNKYHGFTINPDTRVYTESLVPIISNTKLRHCFADIVVPSNYYITSSLDTQSEVDTIPWSEKIPMMFWRGSTTGGSPVNLGYAFYHRHRLVKLATNDSHMDIAFTDLVQCGYFCEHMRLNYPLAPSVPFSNNFKYKYLIDIDGNTFSQRYMPFLQSNSLVFKMTIFQEYFDGWLEPFVHYIPINVDLSDLSEKLQWAIDHDEEAEQIALNSKYFSKRFLTLDQMDCYMYLMLLELARLYNRAD
ncbi:glycosyl transferase family 90-domain-containing protein [Polychytrium aggregatum]|uniref:glycosyl transferase family 90-domain-containing protein n=1 Tax=Polychytrium aggregatum TaxID=110093 RepID=UPI0022FDEDCE|nr:glycosyl transferase family 90-domain-containing protein [Polychytrium aggregatum]KAI9206140.1 glycosyl transferase family 90-domain-containing protein [Polychytrium aggregatum]